MSHPGQILRSCCAAAWRLEREIKVYCGMRFLMGNADAVKLAIDLYANQVNTEWRLGWPPC